MKILLIVASSLILLIVLSTALPRLIISDNPALSSADIACAKMETHQILENPIERMLIIEISVDDMRGDTYFTSAYTFGGLTYASVEGICNEGGQVLWRRWFNP